MKAARVLAAVTMLMTGILCMIRFYVGAVDHLYLFPVCAVVFLTIGILLLMHVKYAPLLGVIFPLAGFLFGLFVSGPDSNDLFLGLIYFLEIIGVILCVILVLGERRENSI